MVNRRVLYAPLALNRDQMFEDSAFDKLFSVSRVEVVQQISVEELKSIIQQLAKSISDLGDGPTVEDVANLRSDVDALKGEVAELRLSNQEQHEALLSKQATSHARFSKLVQLKGRFTE